MFSQGYVWDPKNEGLFGSTQTIIRSFQYYENIGSGTVSAAHQILFKTLWGQHIAGPQHWHLAPTTGNPAP